MLEMRPNCERCDVDLPAPADSALICSFECTFCLDCGDHFKAQCPNCGGALVPRPTRAAALLDKFPPTTERIVKAHD